MAVFRCIRFGKLTTRRALLDHGYVYTARSKRSMDKLIAETKGEIDAISWAGKFAEIKLIPVGPIVKRDGEYYVIDNGRMIPATEYKPNGYDDDRVFKNTVLKNVFRHPDPYMYKAILVKTCLPRKLIKYTPSKTPRTYTIPLKLTKIHAYHHLNKINGLTLTKAAETLGFTRVENLLQFLAELKAEGKIKDIRIV